MAQLRAAFPDVAFWVDAGLSAAAAQDWLSHNSGALVLGSESQTSAQDVAALVAQENNRVILSLDFRDDIFLGPKELLLRTQLWPNRVILMTLARVGADAGPDYERLAEIMSRAEDRQIIAAGGVRDGDDLIRLAAMDVSSVLLASALLDGRIGEDEISAFYEGPI